MTGGSGVGARAGEAGEDEGADEDGVACLDGGVGVGDLDGGAGVGDLDDGVVYKTTATKFSSKGLNEPQVGHRLMLLHLTELLVDDVGVGGCNVKEMLKQNFVPPCCSVVHRIILYKLVR